MTLRERELTVGNRRVSSLEDLKQLPTKGIADVYDGQFVVVDSVDYAEMVGAKNYITLPEQHTEWSAPSAGYAYLDGVGQHLEALANKTAFSMQGTNGNAVSFWFNLDSQEDCTLLHVPTLSSVYAPNPSSPYGIRGLSINVGTPTTTFPNSPVIPGNSLNTFNLYINFGFTFTHGPQNQTVNAQLSRQTGYGVDAGKWHNVVLTLNNESRILTLYLDGAQILQLDLVYNAEITDACQTLGIVQSEITGAKFTGESQIINHRVLLGAHAEESGGVGGFLKGSVDELFYFNRVISPTEVSNAFYSQGKPLLGRIDFSQCVHHWSIGDQVPVPTEVDTLRMDNSQNAVYIETAESTEVWREDTYKTQVVVRPLGDSPSDGFAETRSHVTLDPSFRGVGFSPGSDGGFSALTSGSGSSAWNGFGLWDRGTIVVPFFVDSTVLAAAPNSSNRYTLLNVGYISSSPGDLNGLRVYLSGTTPDTLSLHVELYDSAGTLWSAAAYNHVEDLSWNMCTVSFDLSDTNKTERLSLYVNGKVSDVVYDTAPITYAKVTTTAVTYRRVSLGAAAYDEAGHLKYKDPFYGKIDQVIISSAGDPSDHGNNNLTNETSAAITDANLIGKWVMSPNDSFGISGVYGPSNNVRESVNPGTPDSITGPDSFGLDLFGIGSDTTDLTTLTPSEGHSGTSLPVPRAVPVNWGTYFFDKDRYDFSEEYSNDPDYGFIVVRPSDRSADQAGRWVSVISYTVWTAYLFGSSEEDLRLEEGQLANVEEGDLAVFNSNGQIVPIEPIEQWVNPTFFANAKPRPDSSGHKGQRCYDGSYMYECVAPDMWVRYQIANSWV